VDGAYRIIGVDCAVDAKNVAVAAGEFAHGSLRVMKAVQCTEQSAADAICSFAAGDNRTLIALDAPLGWPDALGRVLADHRAGERIGAHGHALFRRRTDVVVKAETGQQPLDVGADRIARTAAAALALLSDTRVRLSHPIPLAWTPEFAHAKAAIEVYPAATLRQMGIVPRSYKKPAQADARASIVERLSERTDILAVGEAMRKSADMLDAVVCVIAGADFLAGQCRAPSSAELPTAEREGWIWFRA
jgi:predicted RNase H-like nuclease